MQLATPESLLAALAEQAAGGGGTKSHNTQNPKQKKKAANPAPRAGKPTQGKWRKGMEVGAKKAAGAA